MKSLDLKEQLRPTLESPFPRKLENWVCPVTGLSVPKNQVKNVEWRFKLLSDAENDKAMQDDLLIACSLSKKFWFNAFMWTFHQFDVDPVTGNRLASPIPDVPFITWEIQDELLDTLDWCLANGKDLLINKSRDMGASWKCAGYDHWHWLFTEKAQILEMSRTKEYVDKTGNMKALFQKHDYINSWLPWWMRPPGCMPGGDSRQNMHMFNELNGACIDGESTTEHAASGDRRLIILLDEFSKVKHGRAMRSATRDAGVMRIVNSTVSGAGTEYSRWKNSTQIKVFPLMWWDHPEKGSGRYTEQDKETGKWRIRSPWYNAEEKVRSRQEMAQEVDADDVAAGDVFFNEQSITTHDVLFGRKERLKLDVEFTKGVADDAIRTILKHRDTSKIRIGRKHGGKLRLWCKLENGRPDQRFSYAFGIDISKGHGASNSVVSIRCVETGEKVGEWVCANTPPSAMARVVVAIALWFGGRDRTNLPFLIWEKNGPGMDFGARIVKEFKYPRYYRNIPAGKKRDEKSDSYGWHASTESKEELLTEYERALEQGIMVNRSHAALEEARRYVRYENGGIGPADLVEENEKAKKTHGDRVIADALTLKHKKKPRTPVGLIEGDMFSHAARRAKRKKKRDSTKTDKWRRKF